MLRKAKAHDVDEMLLLINRYAGLSEVLPRSRNYVFQNLRDFLVVEKQGRIVGCGSVHVLWEDMAEIRALVIEPQWADDGLSTQATRFLVNEARQLGVKSVYVFSQHPRFFERLGFRVLAKDEVPRRLWAECIDCVKFPDVCDEVAMGLELWVE